MNTLPIVVAVILAVSLAEAFLVLPSHLSSDVKWSRWPLVAVRSRVERAIEDMRDQVVAPAVSAAVRRPWTTISICAAVVAGAWVAVWAGAVRTGFMEPLPAGRLQADLTFPVGTSPTIARAGAERVIRAAQAIADESGTAPFTGVSVVVGRHLDLDEAARDRSRDRGGHLASVVVHLQTRQGLGMAPRLEREWRLRAGRPAGAESVHYRSGVAISRPDVAFMLAHDDADVLAEAVDDLAAAYRREASLFEIRQTGAPGDRQFDIALTDAGIAAGLSPQAVGQQLRARYHGIEVQRIERGREEIRVMLRYPADERRGVDELVDEMLATPSGAIRLSTAADVVETRGPAKQLRVDGVPAASVTARVHRAAASVAEVNARMTDDVLPALAAKHPGLRVELAGNAYDRSSLLESFRTTVPTALLVIYFVAAMLLNSYLKAFLVLVAIPLTVAGAVFGHATLGYEIGMVSLLGIVAVGGIALNDGLVLMHRYRRIQAEQALPAIAAVSAAVRQRFRAILLTTATTVAGLLPLWLAGGSMWEPMAVAIIFGLIFATVLSLGIVPILFSLLFGVRFDQFQY